MLRKAAALCTLLAAIAVCQHDTKPVSATAVSKREAPLPALIAIKRCCNDVLLVAEAVSDFSQATRTGRGADGGCERRRPDQFRPLIQRAGRLQIHAQRN